MPGGRRGDHQGHLRDLRRAGLSACALAGAGCRDGQPLAVHTSNWVRELIEQRGCQLWLLPSYSPDFNPIEEAFSKVKNLIRKAKARTLDLLFEATTEALAEVSEDDARGFFEHCGYRTPEVHSI